MASFDAMAPWTGGRSRGGRGRCSPGRALARTGPSPRAAATAAAAPSLRALAPPRRRTLPSGLALSPGQAPGLRRAYLRQPRALWPLLGAERSRWLQARRPGHCAPSTRPRWWWTRTLQAGLALSWTGLRPQAPPPLQPLFTASPRPRSTLPRRRTLLSGRALLPWTGLASGERSFGSRGPSGRFLAQSFQWLQTRRPGHSSTSSPRRT